MADANSDRRAGLCPVCGGGVPVPEFLAGMWSGAKVNGMSAGGGVFEAMCAGCGAALEAFNDVYDDSGRVPVTDQYVPPELVWGVRRSEPEPPGR